MSPQPERVDRTTGQDPFDCLAGGGEMGARMRAFDWSQTPLGSVADWPQSLRTAASLLLSSRHPMFIWWGPDLVQLYNDGYRPSLGSQMHPRALGQRGKEFWAEIWPIIGPQIAGVMTGGQETWHEDQLVPFDRDGYLEEIYFTYGYSPIRDESGGVGGTLVVCTETTQRVLSERRLQTLHDLATRSAVPHRDEEACRLAGSVFAKNPWDLPFVLLYLIDAPRHRAHLAGLAGIAPGTPASPASVDLDGGDAAHPKPSAAGPPLAWPLARVAATGQAELVADLGATFGALPTGAWPDAPSSALVLPVTLPGHALPAALLVAALNPRKSLDETYRSFLDLAADQVATALAHSRAYEEKRRWIETLDELRRAKEIAEAANQAKDRFLATLSHELRTPLTPVLAVVSRLEQESGLAASLRTELARVRRNVELEARLIDDLLDLTRITRGKLELRREVVDLGQVIGQALETCGPDVERFAITLDLTARDPRVWGDASRLAQVFCNLLHNAVKFSPQGGDLTLRSRDLGPGRLALEVEDTGIGIEPEVLPRIFDGFEQGERTITRRFGGLGLGLAISKAIVELHGGTLAAASPGPGHGAVFTVELPAGLPSTKADTRPAVHPADAADAADAADTAEAKAGAEPSLHILLVEDHLDTAIAMTDLLVAMGHRVTAAAGVREGLAAAAAAQSSANGGRIDLVVSDLGLPDGHGHDLMRELKSRHGLSGIALSGYGMEEDIEQSQAAGFDLHLTKPIGIQVLEAAIREAAKLRPPLP